MRILTNSKNHLRGLIGISEAEIDSPQNIIFCIPIEKLRADRISNLQDFVVMFRQGISTKIMDYGETQTIKLDFEYNYNSLRLPKFTAKIKGHTIDFYLSPINLNDENTQYNSIFNFDFYYEGARFENLRNNRFVILEPNWKQLDELFLKEDVVFVDWTL